MRVLDRAKRFEVKVGLARATMKNVGELAEGKSGSDFRQMKEEKEAKEGDRVRHAERSSTS
jgi:hypothetical protein